MYFLPFVHLRCESTNSLWFEAWYLRYHHVRGVDLGSWLLHVRMSRHAKTYQSNQNLEYCMHVFDCICIYTYRLYWSELIILLLVRSSSNICMLQHFGNDVRGTCLHCLPGSLQWCRENVDSADFLQDWTVEFFNFQSISEKMLPPSPPKKTRFVAVLITTTPF